jgi:predicted unusual protein kinase regulating ubiquinone biosynthesis (AarF/ABC1/UbiB family)
MKGASMKLGQMLSADPDMVPPELADALATLQTESPPMPWPVVKDVLTRAWGTSPESLLAEIDQRPCGSASIGQVHRATLRDGRAIAVKVQYPGVEAALADDVRNLRSLMRLSRVVFDKARVEGWLAEVEAQLLGEVDYLAEAEALAGFARVFDAFEDFAVPRPVPGLTTRNVLAMTWLEGEKLDRAARPLPEDERSRIAERMARTWIALFFRHRWLHGDPHPGNFLLLGDGRIGVLDFGATKRLPAALTDGVMDLFERRWQGDDHGALTLLGRLGFGEQGAAGKVEPALLGDYLRLILAPFLVRSRFDYASWKPHAAIKRMTLRHPSLWKLAPPRDLLPVLRVASGLKGLFGKLGASVDVRSILEETRAAAI